MEENFAKIERENRILLEKMSDIMRKNTLDNTGGSHKYAHSLNKEARKRELGLITRENQDILNRIQGVKPSIDRDEQLDQARTNQQYGENIKEYKYSGR